MTTPASTPITARCAPGLTCPDSKKVSGMIFSWAAAIGRLDSASTRVAMRPSPSERKRYTSRLGIDENAWEREIQRNGSRNSGAKMNTTV